jgi:hypothetical protein
VLKLQFHFKNAAGIPKAAGAFRPSIQTLKASDFQASFSRVQLHFFNDSRHYSVASHAPADAADNPQSETAA